MEMNNELQDIEVGAEYKHFKGYRVKVLGFAKHTETDENLVLYTHVGVHEVFARPYEMFAGHVNRNEYYKGWRFIKEES